MSCRSSGQLTVDGGNNALKHNESRTTSLFWGMTETARARATPSKEGCLHHPIRLIFGISSAKNDSRECLRKQTPTTITMKWILPALTAGAIATSAGMAQNLLLNGDFNSPNSVAAPDLWSLWSFGGGYSNHELITPAPSVLGNYDGTYQMTLGAANTSGGGGAYQTVSATAGMSYTLSVDAGAQDWWLPTGEIRLFFLDASDVQLSLTTINTTDGIHGPDQFDVGVAYQNWSFSAIAPAGTTQAKVELAGFGGGSVWFDNAVLTIEAVPEPSAFALGGVGLAILMISHRSRRSRHD